ncbi:MAG: hypothetical protein JSU61_06420 [Fidelibacterota bacterium]|nr:MAG: hypothetical protein JSU61_06420 [Candidatus Neomarinimicrobiota bacterium]
MGEIYRLLTRGGFALVQVPIAGERTQEDPDVSDPITRELLYGQGDHVRRYGMDIAERLTRAGFKVEAIPYSQEFDEAEQIRMALDREELLFACHKDSNPLASSPS